MDFNRRADDKTNANILILGNGGQGKSYLLKLLLTNLRRNPECISALWIRKWSMKKSDQ